MNKNFIILLVATVMVLSSFTVALNGNTIQNSKSVNSSPETTSGAAYVGDVTIYANGTVSAAGVMSQSGDTYTLLSGINGTLTDQRSNSIVNGAGLTINGLGITAISALDVSGIEVENADIVNSSYGLYLVNVSNALLTNNTVVGTDYSTTMANILDSSNITVQNSDFAMYTSATYTFGVFASVDTSVNISHNMFTGATSGYFVYTVEVSPLSAWHNTVMSTYSYAHAFYMSLVGNATLGYNYVNDTYAGIYGYVDGSIISLHNQFYNMSRYGFFISKVSTLISSHDSAPANGYYGAYLYGGGRALLQYDNFSNSPYYGVYADLYNNVTIANSNLSFVSNGFGVYAVNVSTLNVYSDQIYLGASNAYGIEADYTSGVNLVGDHIVAPDAYGLYLSSSPHFNVTDSYINASYNIYLETSVFGANINNNTFVTNNNGVTVEMNPYPYLYNFVFTDNTVVSPASNWAGDGVFLFVQYASSDIVVSGNTFHNNYDPVVVQGKSYRGTNVWVQDNTFVNSSEAILVAYSSNVVITGNTILNVTDMGIYAFSNNENGQFIISYNTIDNLPGFGPFSFGINFEYISAGVNVISNNTVFNGGQGALGIYVYFTDVTYVFNNVVNDTEYAYSLEENKVISLFDNVGSYSHYGLHSIDNVNFSYYGNTFSNDNISMYSEYDYLGTVFGNTFMDNQVNASGTLYFLYLYMPLGMITFYHNNFLNETTNSTTANYYDKYEPGVFMNAPLPVGGNYYSNYTGTGSNGIGNTPVTVYGSLIDYYPLTSRWTSPTVTFIETGLPSGTSWSVSLGSSLKTSPTGSIVYSPTNGEYMNTTYSVSNVSGYIASSTSGSVYLNGNSHVITIAFTPYTYDVTFTESSLPSGTSWSVTLNGQLMTSTTSAITFAVPNGTYSYTIGSVTGYHTSVTSGSVTVNTGSQSIAEPFTQNTYTLTVNELGLPSGDSWTFTLNGTQHTSTTNVIALQVTSATYTLNATGPTGYNVSVQKSVTVNNANASVTVTFSQLQNTTAATHASSGDLYIGMGVGVVIGAVAAAIAMMFYTSTGIFSSLKKGKGEKKP